MARRLAQGVGNLSESLQPDDQLRLCEMLGDRGLSVWFIEDDQNTCALYFESSSQDIAQIVSFVQTATSGFDSFNDDGGRLAAFKTLIDGV